MTKTRVGLAIAAVAALSLSGWYYAGSGDPIGSSLPKELFAIDQRHTGTAGRPTVILIGENHASSKSQADLYTILGEIHRTGLLGAILVEGSNGLFNHKEFSEAFQNHLAGRDTARFWVEQMEWGRIAGYEAFALAHPEIPVLGVEEMGAKKRHDISLTSEAPRKQLESYDRGAELAAKAVAALGGAGPADLQTQLASYKRAVDDARRAFARFEEAYRPIAEKEVEYASLVAQYQKEATAHNETVRALRKEFGERLERAQDDDPRIRKLVESAPRLKSMEERIKALSKADAGDGERLKSQFEARRKAEQAAEDGFFLLANAVSKASGGRVPELQSFYLDEATRGKNAAREGNATTSDEQNARDQAMVAGTVDYLNANAPRAIVLVVGSHHLKNVSALLKLENLTFVAGRLTANDRDLEPWEGAAWTRRRKNVDRVYSRVADTDLKEISRLLNPVWKEEQTARLGIFRRFERTAPDHLAPTINGLIHDGVIYEGIRPGRDLAVHVSRFQPDRNADFGAHVVDFGPDPSAPDRYFMTFDRAAAGKIVQEESRRGTVLSYYYKTWVDGKSTYQVVTPSGKMSLPEFKATLPKTTDGTPTARVVLFGEPDVVQENPTVAAEPLWRSLRDVENLTLAGDGNGNGIIDGKPLASTSPGAGRPSKLSVAPNEAKARNGKAQFKETSGNGGGQKPPTGPQALTSGEPPRGRKAGDGGAGESSRRWAALLLAAGAGERSPVYRTNNPERAMENLRAVDLQDPKFLGEIRYYEAGQLDELPFTPSRGDNAQVVVIVAQNVEEFRSEIARAAEAHTLQNKQIALVTCGNAFPVTEALRERLLQSGSLMVWTPDRQVTPQAAAKLKGYIQEVDRMSPGARPATIDRVIRNALQLWAADSPSDADLHAFLRSSTWVRIAPYDDHRDYV